MRLMHIKIIYDYLAENALNIETVVRIKSRERQDILIDIATRLPNERPGYHGTITNRSQRCSLQNFQSGLKSLSLGVQLPECEADHS